MARWRQKKKRLRKKNRRTGGGGGGKKMKRKEDLPGRTKINGVWDIDYTHINTIHTQDTHFNSYLCNFVLLKWPGQKRRWEVRGTCERLSKNGEDFEYRGRGTRIRGKLGGTSVATWREEEKEQNKRNRLWYYFSYSLRYKESDAFDGKETCKEEKQLTRRRDICQGIRAR